MLQRVCTAGVRFQNDYRNNVTIGPNDIINKAYGIVYDGQCHTLDIRLLVLRETNEIFRFKFAATKYMYARVCTNRIVLLKFVKTYIVMSYRNNLANKRLISKNIVEYRI